MENDVDLWEMAQICVEIPQLFDKRLKKVEMVKILGKWFRYMGHGLSI